MSIRLSFKDGYWYVDVRPGTFGTFKPDSRHTDIEAAIKRARELGGKI